MNRGIELRHLRYFIAVADHGHVGKAAEALHVSQPAVSMQIRQLEERAGARLVEHVGRGIALTDAGLSLAADARRLLQQLDRDLLTSQQIDQGARGRLRVGFVSTATYGPLPQRLKAFKASHPNVVLELAERTVNQQIEALRRGELDAAIAIAPLPNSGFDSTLLWSEPVVCCLPADHRLAPEDAIPLAALRSEPLVGFSRDLAPGLFDAFGLLAQAGGFKLQFAQLAIQMQTIVGLVSAGFGCAFVPECMIRLNRPDVVYRPLIGTDVRLGTCVLLPKTPSPIARRFVSELRMEPA